MTTVAVVGAAGVGYHAGMPRGTTRRHPVHLWALDPEVAEETTPVTRNALYVLGVPCPTAPGSSICGIALSHFCYRRRKTLAAQGPRKLPKLDVAGSTPVARSLFPPSIAYLPRHSSFMGTW